MVMAVLSAMRLVELAVLVLAMLNVAPVAMLTPVELRIDPAPETAKVPVLAVVAPE